MAKNKFDFRKVAQNLEQLKRELPVLMVNDAQNHFLSHFKKQGFEGSPWREVQRRIPGTAAYRYPLKKGLARRTKPINILTGRMRRAVASTAATARITRSKFGFSAVMFIPSNTVPYAGYINAGTDNMVARPFMKGSRPLSAILKRRITTYTNKIWA